MIENETNKMIYTVGDSNIFAFPVTFSRIEDIHCYLKNDSQPERELILNVDFSVEKKSDYSSGANITLMIQPLPSGATLAIYRELQILQQVSLPNGGKLPSRVLELGLDKLTMICQQLAEKLSRALVFSATDSTNSGNNSAEDIIDYVAKSAAAAGDAANKALEAVENIDAAAESAANAAESAANAAESAANAAESAVNAAESAVNAAEKFETDLHDKADIDFNNVNENIDFIVEHNEGTGEDGGVLAFWWYDKYRSGKVVQGGVTPSGATAAEMIISLPVEMADALYTPLVTIYGEDGFYLNGVTAAYYTVSKLTETGFSCYTGTANNTRRKFWRVEGKAATE